MCKEEENKIKDIQVSTENVFNMCTLFPNLNLPKGVSLDTILRKVDYKLGDNANTVNYNYLSLDYLKSKFTIDNFKNFVESVDNELKDLNDNIDLVNENIITLTNSNNETNQKIEDIQFPQIVDTNGLGFTVNDTINFILQKLANHVGIDNSTSSPDLVVSNSNSINLVATGNQKHTLQASAKISPSLNNRLQVLPDGMYVAPVTVTKQNLSINGAVLSITDGNSVTLPTSGLQSLSVNGNNLSISNGNTVTLPTVTQTPISTIDSQSLAFVVSGVNNHTVTADLKISNVSDNLLSLNSTGVIVTISANQIVDKIVNSTDPAVKTILCDFLSTCNTAINYNWLFNNTGSSSVTISYRNTSGVITSTSLSANSSITLSARSIYTAPTSTLSITFMGNV